MHIAFPVRYITSKISAIIVLYAAILWYAARNAPEQAVNFLDAWVKENSSVCTVDDRLHNSSIFSRCNLTVFDHLHPTILPFHHPGYNPLSSCQPLPPLVQLQKGRITMLEASEGFRCRSRCVLHGDESYYRFGDWVPLPTSANFSCDIMESDCWAGLRRISQMHSQIFEQSVHKSDNVARPDVILIILDSVSSSMAKRSLPKLIKFLKEEMLATQMEFLNSIADYSKPNGFALAFGKSIRPLKNALHGRLCTPDWNVKDICRNYLDKLNYYLHQYGEHGYKTMVANDGDRGIVFYPNCVGFKRPEADHIWRPFDLRRADFSMIRRRHELLCSEPHTEMLNYLQNFVDSYEGVPKIGQLWITGLAHGGQKDLYHADDHFFEFFSRNREKLDNSFIFFMGDHGPRVKGILEPSLGFYELKNPVLLVTMPKKYRNTEIHFELQKKSHQLMTPFDVHATLMDILMSQPEKNFTDASIPSSKALSSGSSLLRRWNETRNCMTLPIPTHLCLCQHDTFPLTNESLKADLGRFIARAVNDKIHHEGYQHLCHEQHYNSTLSANVFEGGDGATYEVLVSLSPGNGMYYTILRNTAHGMKMLTHLVQRNEYRLNSDCVRGISIQRFCQCRHSVTISSLWKIWRIISFLVHNAGRVVLGISS